MAFGFTSYEVENDQKFAAAIERSLSAVNDLRVPFRLIAVDFFKSRRAIFALKSRGAYPDFKSEKSKNQKIREVGFAYPLLRRTGKLEASITSLGAPNQIAEIGKRDLKLGTQVPYGKYHQSDRPRTKIPLRKFLFIGPEGPKFSSSELSGFPKRSLNTLNTFILRSLGANIKAATGVAPKVKIDQRDIDAIDRGDIK